MTRLLLILTTTVLLLGPRYADAQDRFGIELRAGPEFPTQTTEDADLETGFGGELVLSYRFYSNLAVYGGYGYSNSTGADDSVTGNNLDIEDEGYTVGLQFVRPVRPTSYGFYIRAGGTYTHLNIETDSGTFIAETDRGLGWQIGAGPVLSFREHWMVLPGVRYRSLSRDVEIEGTETEIDRTYLSVGVGLMRTF